MTPKFCKKYAKIGEVINSALEEYNREVTSGEFPSGAHTPYRLENNQLDFFLEDLQKNGFHDAAEAANKAALQDEAVDSLLKKTSVV